VRRRLHLNWPRSSWKWWAIWLGASVSCHNMLNANGLKPTSFNKCGLYYLKQTIQMWRQLLARLSAFFTWLKDLIDLIIHNSYRVYSVISNPSKSIDCLVNRCSDTSVRQMSKTLFSLKLVPKVNKVSPSTKRIGREISLATKKQKIKRRWMNAHLSLIWRNESKRNSPWSPEEQRYICWALSSIDLHLAVIGNLNRPKKMERNNGY